MIIEARFNNVMNDGKQVLVCTVKNLRKVELERLLKIISERKSIIVCDDRFSFYNVQNDGIVRIEKEKPEKRHWWSRQ